ncbi:hypothetical protein BDW42DRAFT_159248 [Aspergillus taichungensis]|uniref:Uncharacterized protein n=1 Tax=Aspergillus taichungensis TaxID=482145 RepID=A0A2J5I840_9EURO|nr:hypothetical protein BDW42DRAFT_159248 [Aspergillus taichungensis]
MIHDKLMIFLRSMEDHRPIPNYESPDLGCGASRPTPTPSFLPPRSFEPDFEDEVYASGYLPTN